MPWAKPILYEFKMIPKKPSIPDFYIFYDKILYTLYPANTDFTIFPRYVPGPPPLRRFYNEVKFDNKNDLKLVFLLDLKQPGDLRYNLKRHAADQQIRKHLKALRDECPLPVLHAVSAFGTKLLRSPGSFQDVRMFHLQSERLCVSCLKSKRLCVVSGGRAGGSGRLAKRKASDLKEAREEDSGLYC
ncbi:hypothetical protein EDB83DRAFT_2297762 [Lactarius deliciosus]|nr:hypothetical protein EDB83DRAFT_2297762 [Lactarius deliciosus]